MKQCPECGGSKFTHEQVIHRVFKVTPTGGDYTPPQNDIMQEYYACAACNTIWSNWEDIPDAD